MDKHTAKISNKKQSDLLVLVLAAFVLLKIDSLLHGALALRCRRQLIIALSLIVDGPITRCGNKTTIAPAFCGVTTTQLTCDGFSSRILHSDTLKCRSVDADPCFVARTLLF